MSGPIWVAAVLRPADAQRAHGVDELAPEPLASRPTEPTRITSDAAEHFWPA